MKKQDNDDNTIARGRSLLRVVKEQGKRSAGTRKSQELASFVDDLDRKISVGEQRDSYQRQSLYVECIQDIDTLR